MLKEIKQEDTFITLIKGDFRDADYIYKHYTHPNKDFKKIIAFLIILQKIYNKEDELTRFTQENDISTDLIECFEFYFEKYANCKLQDIPEYDDWIPFELIVHTLPEVIKLEPYHYPRYLEEIKIIKNGKLYEFSKTQTEDNIKKAQKYMINYIKSYYKN